MPDPRCPLCGARSTWMYFYGMPYHLKHTIPDDCHFCRAEESMHWKDWEQGIDVTQFAGTPRSANVETPGLRPTAPGFEKGHIEGVRLA